MDLSSHGIVALVEDAAGKFLLVKEARDLMHNRWAPPHGRCEASDASEVASVIREVKEETGLDVIPIKKLHTQPADTKVKTVSFWLVKAQSTDVTLNEESSQADWFTIDEALRLPLYPGTKLFFEKVKDGSIFIA